MHKTKRSKTFLKSPSITSKDNNMHLNPTQDGFFQGFPLPKIHHTYPTMMRLGTVIPYLRKIQKMYKLRNTHIDWIFIHNF